MAEKNKEEEIKIEAGVDELDETIFDDVISSQDEFAGVKFISKHQRILSRKIVDQVVARLLDINGQSLCFNPVTLSKVLKADYTTMKNIKQCLEKDLQKAYKDDAVPLNVFMNNDKKTGNVSIRLGVSGI